MIQRCGSGFQGEEADIEAEVMNPTRLLGIICNRMLKWCRRQVPVDWEAALPQPQAAYRGGVVPIMNVAWAIEELEPGPCRMACWIP